MTDGPDYIMCNPTATHAPNIAGCARGRCVICAAEIWLAPSSMEMLARNPGSLQTICLDCAPGVMAIHNDWKVMLPTPDQLDELERNRP